MAISENEFKSIMTYVQKKLEEKQQSTVYTAGTVQVCNLEEVVTYSEYKEQKPRAKKGENQKLYSEEFELWWCAFPTSVKYEYKGKKFNGTRALRDKKEEAYPLYEQARKEYSAEQLLTALRAEVETRKIESWKSPNPEYNAMNYMKASTAYLRAKRYEMYVGEAMPIEPLTNREKMTDYTFNG